MALTKMMRFAIVATMTRFAAGKFRFCQKDLKGRYVMMMAMRANVGRATALMGFVASKFGGTPGDNEVETILRSV